MVRNKENAGCYMGVDYFCKGVKNDLVWCSINFKMVIIMILCPGLSREFCKVNYNNWDECKKNSNSTKFLNDNPMWQCIMDVD